MSRMVFYQVRNLEPIAPDTQMRAYGLAGDATPVSVRVVAIDKNGITVDVGNNTFGCRTWFIGWGEVLDA